MSNPNITLVGFMGSGNTVGRILQKRSNLKLVDMDAMIEQRAAKKISDIFAEDGETHFRSLERALSQELSQEQGLIISTGGGIVLNNDNIIDFDSSGLVVCLLASPKTIMDRVQHDDARPLLAGDKMAKILEILSARKPLYEAIEHQVDTTGLSPEAIADQILSLYSTINS